MEDVALETEDVACEQVACGIPEVPFETWLPESETWVVIESMPSSADYVHSKTVSGVLYDLFQDESNRWFRVLAY